VVATDLYGIVTAYTYLGIAFYYIIFDFVSPISDELSLIVIAWLSHNGLMNVWGGAVMAFLALYFRNIILFYLSRNRTRLINALTHRYPVWMSNYQRQMSQNLLKTILILTFIPKVRILVPVAAGLGRVEERRFFVVQALSMALFIAIYYPLGIFFYAGIHSLMESMGDVDKKITIVVLLLFTVLLSFFAGRYIMRKAR
jgi:membrane protein DedA with SNARE-associated domain